jgi:hypothetical protein
MDRGGVQFTMEYVRTTPKALAAYRALVSEPESVRESDLCVWLKRFKCRRMADGSPYFLVVEDGFRFVFCVADGHDRNAENPTVFCLVNVELKH